jgi:F0F1-type ATP synthase gamma subunit
MQVAGKNISANNPRLCGRLRLSSNALRPAKITKEIS